MPIVFVWIGNVFKFQPVFKCFLPSLVSQALSSICSTCMQFLSKRYVEYLPSLSLTLRVSLLNLQLVCNFLQQEAKTQTNKDKDFPTYFDQVHPFRQCIWYLPILLCPSSTPTFSAKFLGFSETIIKLLFSLTVLASESEHDRNVLAKKTIDSH